MTAINFIDRIRFAVANFIAPAPITDFIEELQSTRSSAKFWQDQAKFWENSSDFWQGQCEDLEDEDWEDDIPCCQICHDGDDLGNCPHCKTGIYAEDNVPSTITVDGDEYTLLTPHYLDESGEFHCFAENDGREYFIAWDRIGNQPQPDWNNPRLVMLCA